MTTRILFVLKQRETYWGGDTDTTKSLESGLSNSVRFVVEKLQSYDVDCKMVQVVDNNSIDREVFNYKPTHVIIEAFWVVPEKFDILMKLHPRVKWIVRDHSETPFLANEGIAYGWSLEYMKRGVEIACNAPRAVVDMKTLAAAHGLLVSLVSYLPNVYPHPYTERVHPHMKKSGVMDIGCFGAIRPLKNQMTQAIATMSFADVTKQFCRFHINATRVEGGAAPIVKNLRNAFANSTNCELVEHDWLTHQDFLDVLDDIDISLQVSFSETFNIVLADSAARSVPIVTSSEVPWIGEYAHADPTNSVSIRQKMVELYKKDEGELSVRLHTQVRDLIRYSEKSEAHWLRHFNEA